MNDFDVYSPIHTLSLPLSRLKNIQVDVKRDDMIHPFISGNKWRKLKYIIEKAKAENATHLVTFGGAWSNHILATACICASVGFKSTAYIRGEDVKNPVLQLCRVFGMNLIFTDRETYKNKKALFKKQHSEDPSTFFVDEGGYSLEGAKGCEEIVFDLPLQYDHIFCASGTGATLAGIVKGAEKHQPNALVHGIPVLKGGDFIKSNALKLYPDLKDFKIHLDYHFGGYAKSKPALIDFIKEFCSATGILIEPVYTGKTFFAVLDLIEKNKFNAGDKILIIHTGGLTGFLGKADLF